jgi:crotonobetainyl-CoA:carnitine CoA-transferase CaiB-like acyl-CoA transferase
MKFSETPCEIRNPAPSFGEHTGQILRWLGYSEKDVLDMQEKGII